MALVADQSALKFESFSTVDSAAQALNGVAPRAIFVRSDSSASTSLCLEARAHAAYALVPILSLVDEINDLSFGDVFSWGGDDAVEINVPALVTRVRRLPRVAPPLPDATQGIALIASADRNQRLVFARALRSAGYQIQFAITPDDSVERSRAVDVVVACQELSPKPTELVKQSRQLGSKALWTVMCPPRHVAHCQSILDPLGNAVAADGFAPPEIVVFLVNELRRDLNVGDKRASRRLLYGTIVRFRGAGREKDDTGFAYNISKGGIYVRTLAPPEEPTVWLELRPPCCDRFVRLEAKVCWRKGFGHYAGATAPPGFGVQLTDATRADLQTWKSSYAAFTDELGLEGGPLSVLGTPPVR